MREMEEPQRDIEKFRAECTEDALAMSMKRIKELKEACECTRAELTELEEEHSLAKQQIKAQGRRCKDMEHIGHAKAMLAQVGGKCERLYNTDGSLQ